MAFTPTPSQELAIKTRDRSVLLSAAAGSGKTATLTARIIASLTDNIEPIELSNMLIVTFTRAAASEMRERISKALNDALAEDPTNDFLNRQTVMIASADICTIDSFCLNTVEAHFERLTLDDGSPLPPDFRLADETELKTLALSVMNTVIDSWYEKEAENVDFPKFIENFSDIRGEGNLIDSLLKCVSVLESVSTPDEYLKKLYETLFSEADKEYLDTRFGKMLKDYAVETLKYCVSTFEDLARAVNGNDKFDKNYLPAINNDIDTCKQVLLALDVSYDAAKKVLMNYSSISLKTLSGQSTPQTDACKAMKGEVKNVLEKLRDTYFSFPTESIPEISRRLAGELKTLAAIISDYNTEYAKEKAIRKICSFNDIKRLAHKLLVNKDGSPTDIALSLRHRYKAVYIDEYQDVDPLQDEIFKAVAAPGTRFTVGDIKQSIYAFRGAEPSIFGSMRDSMPNYGTDESDKRLACSLFMSENFRCDRTVIDFVNLVSAHTLVPVKGTVSYRKEDDLLCGKKENTGNTPVKFCVFTQKSDDEESAEIKYIADEIKRLLKEGTNNNGKRIKGSDIAVLARDNKFLDLVSKALSARGIESSNASAQDYFDNPEILLVLSLITSIDNPQKDIPLASAMCSPFFDFSLDELIRIRKNADSSYSLYDAVEIYDSDDTPELNKKCGKFIKDLEDLRNTAKSVPVDRFIRQLYRRFRVMSLVSLDTARHQTQITSNLNRFYEYARNYTKTQHGGLNGFIAYINNFLEAGSKVEAPTVSLDNDAVTLMTMHKSKGLEFPVVFVAHCGKKFSTNFLRNSLIVDSELGIALKPGDETGLARIEPPQRAILGLAMLRKQAEEEMRILYVALTRAREKLYVTAEGTKKFEEQLGNSKYLSEYECRSSVLAASSYLDWMKNAVCTAYNFFELELDPTVTLESETAGTAPSKSCEPAAEEVDAVRKILSERFDYKYGYTFSEKLPAKLSVSRLYPDILDDDGAAGMDSESLPELREKPLFMMDETEKTASTAADRGTATHVFMQFCDFERAERSVRDELIRLVSERFIPEGTAKLVNVRQLENFFKSSFYKTVRSAKRIWREQRFNLLLPAKDFTRSDELAKEIADETLMVQGVIDILVEDENVNIVLCDYKTDYLTPDEIADEKLAAKKLTERHSEQLRYYAEAVKRMFGKEPDVVYIYSLPLGKAVCIF